MLSTTHMAGGAMAVAVFIAATDMDLPPHWAIAAMGAGAVGALLPDIDHPSSKISSKLKPVSGIVTLIFSHRGFFHTPILYALLWWLWLWQCPILDYSMYGNYVFLGAVSHLALDALNPVGIPFFFPIEKKRHHLAKIKTGGKTELLIRYILLSCCAAEVVHFTIL